ncbi:MAG: transcriptional regulator [Kocuria sp.]|uniref:Transcriptional regulator n=1 Tax=Kocuria salsicia TaxID=664639 RepID=A0ABV3KAT6_9MICC|nr:MULTISPECIES: transcriptional regulator [Kocuria]MBS6029501.1 transcriptional regulator [Kocuria rhizophila]MDO4257501.1 transcriptional regulator [Kocuria sp.]
MFVLTIDRRASRRDGPALEISALRDELQHGLPRPVLGWDVSAGDELQALYDDAAAALSALLHLADSARWHVGLGIGPVDLPLGDSVRESTGPAFVAARDAVTRAKDHGAPVVSGNEWAERTGIVLDLVCAVRDRRTDAGARAAALADDGQTQQQMATSLGIAQSSVSRRLAAALWHEEHAVRETLVALLDLADQGRDS